MSFTKHTKSYLSTLEQISNKTRNEAICMATAYHILSEHEIKVPVLHSISPDYQSFSMEYIEGKSLVEYPRDFILQVRDKIKSAVLLLHSHGLSHGDLFPRNVIIVNNETIMNNKIYLIDFEYGRINHNRYEMNRDIKNLELW